jgi:hypothetical protein
LVCSVLQRSQFATGTLDDDKMKGGQPRAM